MKLDLDARLSPKLRTIACMILLFGVNALLCRELFHLEYTNQLGSVEALFISFSRWMMDHWHDRTWIPMWMGGIPARQVYGPGLHTSVAALALWTGWTPQHAHHFLTACAYCLGPVTLFWLIYRVTERRGAAFFAGVFYSLISPSLFVFEMLRRDAGGYWIARRYQNLVVYGEGPHVTDLTMIPLVLWLIHEAATTRRWLFVLLSPIALAILVLTNWTGTTGFAMAMAAYILSRWGAAKYGERDLHWPTLIGIGVIAYMLASPWVPPSLIRTMQIASSQLSPQLPPSQRLPIAVAFAAVLIALHFILGRLRVAPWTRFFAYFAMISGGVVACEMVIHRPLMPIGYRFQLEFEMAVAALVALGGTSLGVRLPRRAQYVLAGVLLVLGLWQGRTYRRYMRFGTAGIDHTQTEEYKMATWIGSHPEGQRIFAPGNLSEWMNLFNDAPQLVGCCDQSVLADEYRMAVYVIYSGDGARDKDAEISTMWLKLYGASSVAVTAQAGQPYVNPKKFDGNLSELWRDGESVIYRVPSSGSLAHVVPRGSLPARHPINGVDVEPLLPLVAAIDNPTSSATLRWMNQHEMEISADTKPGDAIFLQETYDAGWHAYEGSAELRLEPNVLGLTTIEPGAAGHHTIRMVYSGDLEDRLANAAHWIGALLLVVWAYLVWASRQRNARKTGLESGRRNSMSLSARNQLSGVVEEVHLGDVMAHIVVKVGENIVDSVITRTSADEMHIKKGDHVKVVVKSTEVMIQKS